MKKEINPIIPKFQERFSCPVCFSKNLETKYINRIAKDSISKLKNIYKYKNREKNINVFINSDIIICKCQNCHLKFHKNIPNKNTLKFIYSTLINENKALKRI